MPNDSHAVELTLQRLREVRLEMLHLHKELLLDERFKYEQLYGRVSSGQLLDLVINHEQFAWLRSISELIARIDETLDADEPITQAQGESLLTQARTLLIPLESSGEFGQKYQAALQRIPAAVLAHSKLRKLLSN